MLSAGFPALLWWRLLGQWSCPAGGESQWLIDKADPNELCQSPETQKQTQHRWEIKKRLMCNITFYWPHKTWFKPTFYILCLPKHAWTRFWSSQEKLSLYVYHLSVTARVSKISCLDISCCILFKCAFALWINNLLCGRLLLTVDFASSCCFTLLNTMYNLAGFGTSRYGLFLG